MEENLTRREVREGAFIILYQTIFGISPEEICEANEEAFGLARNEETDEIVNGVLAHNEELEQIIAKYSTTRSVSRIAKVNMVIMKIAVYEMKYCERVPNAAAINEAVELSKKYAYKADSGFINGVLNAYLGELDGAKE
ncbi:MAG: transcription antitermination factor NusB [Oscillospiraceae bacterium]|nr:transcription antitermination factor NusB [Oscillospiraceae bacterium]